MNWDAIGAVGEVGGAIAVAATLGYLASQIRQNTRAMHSVASQAVTTTAANYLITASHEPAIAQLLGKILTPGPHEFTETERVQLAYWFRGQFRSLENVYYQQRQGLLGDIWPGYRQTIAAMAKVPFIREFWRDNGESFGPDFRDFIERVIAETVEDPGDAARMILGRQPH